MVKIQNIVSSGSLDYEFDLESVAGHLGSIAEYDPDEYHGMYIRFNEDVPLITLYRTGKYIIIGGDSKEQAYSTRKKFLDLLAKNGMISTPTDEWFQIQNLVCTAELKQSLNLNAVAIGLGLEKTEYEPEQFPGLIYRSPDFDSVVLLFASGRVVITGSSDLDTAERTFSILSDDIADILNIN